MKKYSSAIKFLRGKIKLLAFEGREIHKQIRNLTWKDTPETKEALQKVRKVEGRRIIGKRFFKPFKRPETGFARHKLGWDKQYIGSKARCCIIAMGLLKEKPYSSIEPNSKSLPSVSLILEFIHEAIGNDKILKSEWTHSRINNLIQTQTKKEAA